MSSPAPAPRTASEPELKLTQTERELLEFESRWWQAPGAKTQAIADEFGMTPEQYYQRLAMLIEHPEAAVEQPAVVRRLKQARDRRRASR